jgi:ribosomal protein L24
VNLGKSRVKKARKESDRCNERGIDLEFSVDVSNVEKPKQEEEEEKKKSKSKDERQGKLTLLTSDAACYSVHKAHLGTLSVSSSRKIGFRPLSRPFRRRLHASGSYEESIFLPRPVSARELRSSSLQSIG